MSVDVLRKKPQTRVRSVEGSGGSPSSASNRGGSALRDPIFQRLGLEDFLQKSQDANVLKGFCNFRTQEFEIVGSTDCADAGGTDSSGATVVELQLDPTLPGVTYRRIDPPNTKGARRGSVPTRSSLNRSSPVRRPHCDYLGEFSASVLQIGSSLVVGFSERREQPARLYSYLSDSLDIATSVELASNSNEVFFDFQPLLALAHNAGLHVCRDWGDLLNGLRRAGLAGKETAVVIVANEAVFIDATARVVHVALDSLTGTAEVPADLGEMAIPFFKAWIGLRETWSRPGESKLKSSTRDTALRAIRRAARKLGHEETDFSLSVTELDVHPETVSLQQSTRVFVSQVGPSRSSEFCVA